jgi:hypothetical protein
MEHRLLSWTQCLQLCGTIQGKRLDELVALMQNGTAYVNVHTEQNPQGEIRGTDLLDDDAFELGDDNGGGEGEGEDDDNVKVVNFNDTERHTLRVG